MFFKTKFRLAKRSYPTSEFGGEGGRLRGDTPRPRSGAAAGRSYPTPPKPEARGSGQEEQPHAVAAQAQEGLEELSRVEGQEGRW